MLKELDVFELIAFCVEQQKDSKEITIPYDRLFFLAREIEKLVPSLLVSCDMVGIDSFRCEFKEYVVMEKTQICIHHLNHIYHRIKRFLPSKDLISKMIKIEANGNTILAPEKIYVSTDPFGCLHAYDCENHPPIVEEYIRKNALVKYLSEEKGYPITLNGELVHWDELNKHLAEYNKWKKDAFIEEACMKLKKLMYDNLMFQGRLHREEVIDNFVEDFKKYMEDSL